MIMIMKKQQQPPWMFKQVALFSIINSSSSSNSSSSIISKFNNSNVLRRRPLCSSTTTTTTNTSCLSYVARPPTPTPTVSNNNNNNKKKQQQQLDILLEKKLPLLIVPYDYVTPHRYGLSKTTIDDGCFVCDGNLGFINLFHDHDNQLIINKKKKKKKEVEVYNVYLPEIAERRICGSSEGWLATVHQNYEFQLFNPVTRVIVHLPPFNLPPFTGFPGLNWHPIFPGSNLGVRETFINKVVTKTTTFNSTILQQPTETTVVVMAIYEYYGGLAFYRTSWCWPSKQRTKPSKQRTKPAAAAEWIKIPVKTPMSAGLLTEEHLQLLTEGPLNHVNDITYEVIDGETYWVSKLSEWVDVTLYQGNFYVVDCDGVVGVVKGLDGPSPFVQFLIDGPRDHPKYSSHMNYLVESSSSSSSSSSSGGGGGGDLLLVMRKKPIEETEEVERRPTYRTTGFRVLKLDFNNNGPPSWEEVTDLGEDCALFVGYNHSFSFSASKIPGCRGNCIYFTDNRRKRIIYYPNGGHDIGVYNLEDGSFEKLNYETCSIQLFMPPPVWYVPN